MLHVGRAYNAKNGQRFLILARKNIPSSTGYNFIGENVKTGLVTYFNHKGENAFYNAFTLDVDPYRWVPMRDKGEISSNKFVRKEELEFEAPYYLRITNTDPHTIVCLDKEGFRLTYV